MGRLRRDSRVKRVSDSSGWPANILLIRNLRIDFLIRGKYLSAIAIVISI